ncbi:MAG: dUTP diphosphatase [Oscillospiraceae bacterium]
MEKLLVKKLSSTAIIPTRATVGSAGYDLYADLENDVIILPGETKKINTGIAISLESGNYAAFIYARSGLASNYGIAPANCVGVIDSDYRGEIVVALKNSSSQAFTVQSGQRIAQMVLTFVLTPDTELTKDLDQTMRGEGGFGSTGEK